MLNNKGFASIVEVVVTAIIFVVAAAGIFTAISMLRPQSAESSRRLEAAYISKQVMHQLREEIDAEIWNTPGATNLEVDVMHSWDPADLPTGYTVNFYLVEVEGYPSGEGPRQLFMNVYYPD